MNYNLIIKLITIFLQTIFVTKINQMKHQRMGQISNQKRHKMLENTAMPTSP